MLERNLKGTVFDQPWEKVVKEHFNGDEARARFIS